MSIFIKAGLWLEKKTGFKGEFNLTRYITDLIADSPSGSTYKVYTALLSQTGEEDPEVTVLQNNTGLEFTASRGNAGSYTIAFTGYILDQSKVVILMGPYAGPIVIAPSLLSAYLYDDNTVFIYTTDAATLTQVDGLLKNTSIEIRVYN